MLNYSVLHSSREPLRDWSSCSTVRKFQCSGEIDAVEGVALAESGGQRTAS